MAWIESHQEISRHPKTKRLARNLGISIPTAVGHLHLLWHWCLDYAQDGDLSRHAVEDIADAVMWDDDAQTLVNELILAGFLDTDYGQELKVHNWEKYGGRLLAMRRQNADKQKKWRENQAKESKPTARLKIA